MTRGRSPEPRPTGRVAIVYFRGSSSLLSLRRCTRSASPTLSASCSSPSVRDRGHKMSSPQTNARPITISAMPKTSILRPQSERLRPPARVPARLHCEAHRMRPLPKKRRSLRAKGGSPDLLPINRGDHERSTRPIGIGRCKVRVTRSIRLDRNGDLFPHPRPRSNSPPQCLNCVMIAA
jgi:hypothetical protein